VIGPDHKTVARAIGAESIGLDITEQGDADGYAFGKAFVERASAGGVWVDYRFEDPISGEPLAKSSWLVLHDGHIFGCGIYKP
jgi:signal transduction histidine kinase